MKKTLAVLAASAALLLTLTACGDDTAVNPDPPKPAAEAPAEETPEEAPPAEIGTRENPAPLGSEISSDEWKVVVNSVQLDAGADPAFQEANQYYDITDLPADQQFVMLNVTYTYVGTDPEGAMPAFVQTDLVTPDGVTQPYDVIAVTPGESVLMTTLYTDATVTGSVVRTIPTASIEGAVIAVTPGMMADTKFVSLQ